MKYNWDAKLVQISYLFREGYGFQYNNLEEEDDELQELKDILYLKWASWSKFFLREGTIFNKEIKFQILSGICIMINDNFIMFQKGESKKNVYTKVCCDWGSYWVRSPWIVQGGKQKNNMIWKLKSVTLRIDSYGCLLGSMKFLDSQAEISYSFRSNKDEMSTVIE